MRDVTPKSLEWNDMTVSRYWRWLSKYPEQYFSYQFGDRIAHALRHYIRQGQRVLDYGCGTGFLCRHLTSFGADVWATDVSDEAVASANAINRSVDGFRGARSIDEAVKSGETFDRIISVEVVEHLNDVQLSDFFAALHVLLDSSGLVFITTPNEEVLSRSEVYCPQCDHVFHRWQHMRSFSAATLRQVVEKHGFDVVETYTTDFSKGRVPDPIAIAKSIVKSLCGRKQTRPHLVCIARKKDL